MCERLRDWGGSHCSCSYERGPVLVLPGGFGKVAYSHRWVCVCELINAWNTNEQSGTEGGCAGTHTDTHLNL